MSEKDKFVDDLLVKDILSNERVVLPVSDIVFIETFGHVVEVHAQSRTYQALGGGGGGGGAACIKSTICLTLISFCGSVILL